MNKIKIMSLATIAIIFSGCAGRELVVDSKGKYYEQATFCEKHPNPKYGQSTTKDAVVGGAIGGLIGNQFGKGSGKTASTTTGAVLGAFLAQEPKYIYKNCRKKYVPISTDTITSKDTIIEVHTVNK